MVQIHEPRNELGSKKTYDLNQEKDFLKRSQLAVATNVVWIHIFASVLISETLYHLIFEILFKFLILSAH